MSLLFRNRVVEKGAQQQTSLPFWRRILMIPVHHLQQAVSSLGELWRNPIASLMTVAVLGLSLTLPSALYVMVKNTSQIAGQWQQASEISLFLRTDASQQSVATLKQQISIRNDVESVKWVTKQEGFEQFKATSGFGETLDYFDSNPLPDVLVVTPAQQARTPARAQALLEELQQAREVQMGKLDVDWLSRLQAIVDLIQDVLAALALLLCISVILIVSNTIRLNILSKRDEIVIMKLVGATDAFIQRPFLYTGVWYGVAGGVIAWLATQLLIWWIGSAVTDVTELYQSQFSLSGLTVGEMLMVWLVAVALGLIGSFLAVRKHIKSIEPEA